MYLCRPGTNRLERALISDDLRNAGGARLRKCRSLLGGMQVKSSWINQHIRCCLRISLSLALLSVSQAAGGQLSKPVSTSRTTQAQTAEASQDPLGRATPRGTVMGFLSAAYNQKYDIAAQYLDTRSHGKGAEVLAKQLLFVLDRKLPAKLNNVSNETLGSLSDPVNSRRELVGSVVTESGGVDIYLERVDRPGSESIWLFSRQTLADIPDVYKEINAVEMERAVPDFLLKRYFGVALFGWSYFLLFLPLLYLLLSVVNHVLGAGLGYSLRHWAHRPQMRNPTILPHPVRLLVLSGTIYFTLTKVSVSLLARQAASTIGFLILIVALVWAMFLVNARCELHLKRRMESHGRLSSTAIIRPARRVMDLIAIIVGLMFLLHSLGVNPSAALAGLGVGGIAVALAAQKTLENVIGGVSLIMDGAVRVGEFFKVGDVLGTIEVIGLRSIRVRTLDRTIITIPNGQVATMTLENFSARDRFWLRQLIGLGYQTASSRLDTVLIETRALLERDPRVLPATARVRLIRFAESSLELEVSAYVSARDWNHFLEIQEELLMRIREVIGSTGAEIGYPARTVYLKNESGVEGVSFQTLEHGMDLGKDAVHGSQTR